MNRTGLSDIRLVPESESEHEGILVSDSNDDSDIDKLSNPHLMRMVKNLMKWNFI